MNALIEKLINSKDIKWAADLGEQVLELEDVRDCLKDILTKIEGHPPKDGKRYLARPNHVPVILGCQWSELVGGWAWDAPLFNNYIPTAYLSFNLDDLA